MNLNILLALAGAFAGGWLLCSLASSQSQDSNRLRRIERKLNLLLQKLEVKELPGISSQVQELARDPRQKIAAIKLHREETGCGLGEAKQDVEDFIHSQKLKG